MSDYDFDTNTFIESEIGAEEPEPTEYVIVLEKELSTIEKTKKEVEDTKSKTTTQKKRSEALGGANEDGVFIFSTS